MEHVGGWLDESASDVSFYLVRYEELHANTSQVLAGIFEYFGSSIDVEVLDRAVKNSSFDNSKKDEESNSYGGRVQFRDFSFFRKGQVGGDDALWTSRESDLLHCAAGDLIRRLGYTL
jgi:hypothetical protein